MRSQPKLNRSARLWVLLQCSNENIFRFPACGIDYLWDTIHNHTGIVFYQFGQGCSTHAKELDGFEMLITEMFIDRMGFASWLDSKGICYLCSMSSIDNDYNENSMNFPWKHKSNVLILIIYEQDQVFMDIYQ